MKSENKIVEVKCDDLELPRLSINIMPNDMPKHLKSQNRPFIYEVDVLKFQQFNYEYKKYNIGKLKCMHNHSINLSDMKNICLGESTWYPSMMVLNKFYIQAKQKQITFKRYTIITVAVLITLVLYLSLTATNNKNITTQLRFYVVMFLLISLYTILSLYGLYITHTKYHDEEYIIALSNGTTDDILLKYREELINVIDKTEISNCDNTRSEMEKKYQINR
jgi:hypothetical protein